MNLTVQEIIAKVALQRQSQLKKQYQKDILTQVNNYNRQTSKFLNKNILECQIVPNQHKQVNMCSKAKRNNPQNFDSFQIQDQSLLSQKYKKLQRVFKKLKTKVDHQSKIDEMYSQVVKKLQNVVKKNKKLQKQLDMIQSKRSIIDQKSQLIKGQQSYKRSSVFNLNSVSLQKNNHSKEVNNKYSKLKENNQKIEKQLYKSKESIQKCNVSEHAKTKINRQQNDSSQKKLRQSHTMQQQPQVSQFFINVNKNANSWCKNQIEQYKLMINEKQMSILKLKSLAEKQQQIIKNYQQISSNKLVKEDKIKKVKTIGNCNEKTCTKIEGTIVKLKRVKKSSDYKIQKELSYKNTVDEKNTIKSMNILEADMDEKTKKKMEKNVNGFKRERRRYKQLDIDESGYQKGYNMCQSVQNYEQEVQMNQTSEFICQV